MLVILFNDGLFVVCIFGVLIVICFTAASDYLVVFLMVILTLWWFALEVCCFS